MNPSGQVHGDALTPVFHVEPPLGGGHREEVRRVSVKKDVLEMASTEEEVVKAVLSDKSKLEEKLGC